MVTFLVNEVINSQRLQCIVLCYLEDVGFVFEVFLIDHKMTAVTVLNVAFCTVLSRVPFVPDISRDQIAATQWLL